MLKADNYTRFHQMLCAAKTNKQMDKALRKFQALYDANKDSTVRDDLFDAAWAMSCLSGLYSRLNKPGLAEQAYRKSINLFDEIDMPLYSATLCEALAEFLADHGRNAEAEAFLKQEIVHLVKCWGPGYHYVVWAEEELKHFQLTGKIINASNHKWCQPCNVDPYHLGFDDDRKDADADRHNNQITH